MFTDTNSSEARNLHTSPPCARGRLPGQFCIGDWLVITTIFAVVLATFGISPFLSVALVVITLPALVRTLLVLAIYGSQINAGPTFSFCLEFGTSVAVVIAAEFLFSIVLYFGVFLSFQLGESGGPPLPTPVWWPLGLTLVVAVAASAFALWFTRRISHSVFHFPN